MKDPQRKLLYWWEDYMLGDNPEAQNLLPWNDCENLLHSWGELYCPQIKIFVEESKIFVEESNIIVSYSSLIKDEAIVAVHANMRTKYTLLHEFAHVICMMNNVFTHDGAFAATLIGMWDKYLNIDFRYASADARRNGLKVDAI